MILSSLLIDERGEYIPVELLARRLHSSLEPTKLSQFAILNLGHIGVATKREAVQVTLRPAIVEKRALAKLYFWLHDNRPSRFAVIWFDGAWHQEIFGWNVLGWRRFVDLAQPRAANSEHFRRETVNPAAFPVGHPIKALLAHWLLSSQAIDIHEGILESTMHGRFVIIQPDTLGDLRILEIGRTMMARAPMWRRMSRGMRFSDFPDYHYGRWLEPAYYQVSLTNEPLVEKVDAIVQWPNKQTLSHHYWRAILPVRLGRQRSVLLGATLDRAA